MADSLAGLTGRRVPVDGAGAPAGARDLQAVTLAASFEASPAGMICWNGSTPASAAAS